MSSTSSALSLLRTLVARRHEKHLAFAAEWHTAWNAAGKRKLARDTVESRLSNLFADLDDGWSFFFKDPDRARLLFDLLDASEAEREHVHAAAADRLAGRRAARVCVDLHPFAGDAHALLAAVEDAVLAAPGATPAAVLLTPHQYRHLPLTYADLKEKLELVKVAGPAEAAAAQERFPRALLVATVPPRAADGTPDLARWAAIASEGGRLVIEPPDAVARFLADGALDALPDVPAAHRLDALGLRALDDPPAALDGPALRRRLVALAEGTADGPPATRLAEALAWGVVAASTDAERVQAALRAAGHAVEVVGDDALARLLDRAARRPARGVYVAEDGWHLLNVAPPAALAGHPRVHVHRVEVAATALRRLHEAVSGRTAREMELDPRLDAAVAALDPEGREAAAFAHARAWLLHGGLAPAADRPCPEPMARLGRLLAHEVPRAEVRWRRLPDADEEPARDVLVCAMADAAPLLDSVWEQVPPATAPFWHGRTTRVTALCPGEPPQLDAWWPQGNWRPPARAWEGERYVGRAAVPAALPVDDDAWLDAFEARGPDAPDAWLAARFDAARAEGRLDELMERRRYVNRSGVRHAGQVRQEAEDDAFAAAFAPVAASRARIDDPDWAELDLHLALAWLALRQALASRAPVALHDGRHLLPIQPGLFAEITTVEAPRVSPVRAAFGRAFGVGDAHRPASTARWSTWTLRPSRSGRGLELHASPFHVPVATYAGHVQSTGAMELGVVVPAELHLVGEGVAATVRFRAEPYGLAGMPARSTAT